MVDSGWKGMLVENAGWIGFRSNLRSAFFKLLHLRLSWLNMERFVVDMVSFEFLE